MPRRDPTVERERITETWASLNPEAAAVDYVNHPPHYTADPSGVE
jgi:hypothetical protein